MRCDDLAEVLAAHAGELWGVGDEQAHAHVGTCLRCQAELARYRKLTRALRSLRGEYLAMPLGLVSEVMTALEEEAARLATRSLVARYRGAYVGGLAVATAAAGAAGMAVMVARSRGRRVRLAS